MQYPFIASFGYLQKIYTDLKRLSIYILSFTLKVIIKFLLFTLSFLSFIFLKELNKSLIESSFVFGDAYTKEDIDSLEVLSSSSSN